MNHSNASGAQGLVQKSLGTGFAGPQGSAPRGGDAEGGAGGIVKPTDAETLDSGPMSFGLFQREQRSLFGEILDWMLTPLLLLWPLSLALTWFVAQGIASKPFDRALEFNLQALTQFVVARDDVVSFNLTPQARDLLRADDSDLVYYQLLDPRGELLSGEVDFPLPRDNETPEPGRVLMRDDVVRGDDVRVAYTWLARHSDSKRLVLMQVAETKGKRSTLATEIIKGVMVPQFVILPLAVLLVWLALVRGIRPLNELERRIRARKPDDLSPIEESFIPQEVAPLVSSINDLLTRLKVSLGTQKRFLADAAHQLKTPLAGLRMQADLAQRETDPVEMRGSLQQIARSSTRATHTVNQLLLAGTRRDHRPHPAQRPHRPGRAGHRGGAGLGASRAGARHRSGLRRPRDHAAGLHHGRQPNPAAGNGAQPGGQRHPLFGAWRRRDSAGAGRPLQRRADSAGGRRRPGHRRERARAGDAAVLPRAGHQRRRLGPGPGHRAGDRAAARGDRAPWKRRTPTESSAGCGYRCASHRKAQPRRDTARLRPACTH